MSDYSTGGPPPGRAAQPAGGGSRGAGGGPPPGPPGAGDRGGGGPAAAAGRGSAGAPSQPPGGGGPGIRKDAFADAVQRARQIAAKIGGDAATTVNNNTPDFGFGGQKRQLEDGDQPESKKLASQGDSISSQLGPIHPPPRTSMTEEYRVPDGMVGLIIGRGGEQINKIQQDSGCKVQISPDSGGLPERSVSLTGAPESVQKAKMMLDDIVSRGRGGPPGQFHDNANGGQNGTVQEIMIPAGKAGLVIGKGGETIKQLQERAGVKMILIQDGSQNTNVDKPLRIIGDPYKVQQACEMVMDILRERDQGGFGDRNEYGSRIGGGIDVPVPRHSVGVVIGRSGEMIKKIQNDAGVRIQFKQGQGLEKIEVGWGGLWGLGLTAWILAHSPWPLSFPPGSSLPSWTRPRGPRPCWPNGLARSATSLEALSCQLVKHTPLSASLRIPGGLGAFPCCLVEPGGLGLWPLPTQRHVCPSAGGPPPHQYPPQGWGNTYPQWQPPAPHDPRWALLCARQPPGPVPGPAPAPAAPPAQGEPPQPPPTGQSDYTKAWEEYYKKIGQQPQQPGAPPQQDYTKAWEEYYKKQAQVATGGGPGAPPGSQPDYSAAWAEYYRQQAAYYGQTPGPGGPQPPPTQQGQHPSSLLPPSLPPSPPRSDRFLSLPSPQAQ
uniref:KH-type splicing regulatory protein n=1 Tax=Aotus nancymaae TaxID=37293 RepID=A0A2K5DFD4_AOTNA